MDLASKFDTTCSCCVLPMIIVAVFATMVTIKCIEFFLGLRSPREGKGHLIFSWISGFIMLAVTLVAILLGVLSVHEGLREKVFAAMCTSMTRNSKLDPVRCGLLRDISGAVLEFGPGPGTNFRCWGNAAITKWVGVEPNNHFAESAELARKNYSISFPSSTVWFRGENADVEPEAFDAVVVTHVLCSVSDTVKVLQQAHRALKPGGTFYFMEHVAAPAGTTMRYVQYALSPVFHIVGNGCAFKETWTDVQSSGVFAGYNITINHFDADMPLPFLAPHIVGTARKPVAVNYVK
jgi:SAM-dependent methyltransferase